MPHDGSMFVPLPVSTPERRDTFVASSPDDDEEIRRLRREIVRARQRRDIDLIQLEDAADRSAHLVKLSMNFRLGSIIQHYGRGRAGRLLERMTRNRPGLEAPMELTTLAERYTRLAELRERRGVTTLERWAHDTVALILVGDGDAAATRASHAPFQIPGDVVIEVAPEEIAAAVASLSSLARPQPAWVMVLRAGELLAPGAVAALVAAAGERSIGFGDDDYYDEQWRRVDPCLRSPSIGAISALSYDQLGSAAVLRRSLADEVARSAGTAVVQAALHLAQERGDVGSHVARSVLTRPQGLTPVATPQDLLAVTRATLERRRWGSLATTDLSDTIRWQVRDPDTWPEVCAVVPTRDRADLLERCLKSLRDLDYPALSLVVVDNDSRDPSVTDVAHRYGAEVVTCPGPFHFARLVNAGASAGSGEVIAFVNNDCEFLERNAMKDLVRMFALPFVGVVGAILRDEDGSINHAGHAIAARAVQLRPELTWPSSSSVLDTTRDVVAVTGACQLIRRDLFEELGGHDDVFIEDCSDVDLCLRASQRGFSTAVVASGGIVHLEGASRGKVSRHEDEEVFAYRWGLLDGFLDPYTNEALDYLDGARFVLR